MNFTLNQLKVFIKVVETKSITKAALELHLTQPAVSIQLRNFQDSFDIGLTEVFGRQLYITDFGQEVYHTAQKIMLEAENLEQRSSRFRGELSGRLKISVVSTGKYIIPYFLTDFLQINPKVELVLDVTNREQVMESLEKNQVDFSLVSVLPEKISIKKIELMENRLYLVGKSGNTIIVPKTTSEAFTSLPLIFREKGSGTRFTIEKYMIQKKIESKKKLELASNEAVKQAVLAGLGYSVMPLIGIKNELQSLEMEIIPLPEFPLISTWNLIWLRDKEFSPAPSEYLKYIAKEKERIIQEHFGWQEKFHAYRPS